MNKGFCYWCGELLTNKAYRRYIGQDTEGNGLHEYFCDEVCLECFENDLQIEKGTEEPGKIKGVKIQKNGYKRKQCSTCGRCGKAQDFSSKIVINAYRGNNSGKKYYLCNHGCLETFIKKVSMGEAEI